jgi:ribosomal protein S18 acetylase RimI-like enzyme
MKAVISEAYGWDEEAQREIAAESLAGQVVLVDEEPVGVLTLDDWGDQLHLTWMAILPEMQGQGLGGELLEHCQRRAIEAGKPVTLQVLRNNPAVRLYERFGFRIYASDGSHKLLMRWNHSAG